MKYKLATFLIRPGDPIRNIRTQVLDVWRTDDGIHEYEAYEIWDDEGVERTPVSLDDGMIAAAKQATDIWAVYWQEEIKPYLDEDENEDLDQS